MTADERKSPRRGEIVAVNLEDSQGAERKKKRAKAIVVSADLANEALPTIVVIPLIPLRGRDALPYEVAVPKGLAGTDLTEDYVASPYQIRTVDVACRVTDSCGRVSDAIMHALTKQLFLALGAIDMPPETEPAKALTLGS